MKKLMLVAVVVSFLVAPAWSSPDAELPKQEQATVVPHPMPFDSLGVKLNLDGLIFELYCASPDRDSVVQAKFKLANLLFEIYGTSQDTVVEVKCKLGNLDFNFSYKAQGARGEEVAWEELMALISGAIKEAVKQQHEEREK